MYLPQIQHMINYSLYLCLCLCPPHRQYQERHSYQQIWNRDCLNDSAIIRNYEKFSTSNDINNDVNNDVNNDIDNDINNDINDDINNDVNNDINNDIDDDIDDEEDRDRDRDRENNLSYAESEVSTYVY